MAPQILKLVFKPAIINGEERITAAKAVTSGGSIGNILVKVIQNAGQKYNQKQFANYRDRGILIIGKLNYSTRKGMSYSMKTVAIKCSNDNHYDH
jgi:hypothetical protein